MKFSNVFRTVTVAAAVALTARTFAQDIVSAELLDDGTGLTMNWLGDPGVPHGAYVIVGSPSLVDPDTGGTATNKWVPMSDYITPITEWQFETTVPFTFTNDIMFYRVERVDREGPAIEYVSPAKDAVSVPVDAEISVRITDESGVVEDNSMAIYVGDARHALGDDDVTWDGSVLTYTGGNLGNPGDTVDVWATAKDTKGNVTSSEQSLLVLAKDVETVSSTEPQVVPFLVIGAGEENVTNLVDKVSESPGTAARSIAGIRSAGISGTLVITNTTDDTLVFAYTGNAYELLAVDQLWASENADNIFYRKITAIHTPDETIIEFSGRMSRVPCEKISLFFFFFEKTGIVRRQNTLSTLYSLILSASLENADNGIKRIARIHVNAGRFHLPTEPCQLPFGVIAGLPLHILDNMRYFGRGLCLQQFTVPKTLPGRCTHRHNFRQTNNFIHPAVMQHLVYTGIYSFVQNIA